MKLGMTTSTDLQRQMARSGLEKIDASKSLPGHSGERSASIDAAAIYARRAKERAARAQSRHVEREL